MIFFFLQKLCVVNWRFTSPRRDWSAHPKSQCMSLPLMAAAWTKRLTTYSKKKHLTYYGSTAVYSFSCHRPITYTRFRICNRTNQCTGNITENVRKLSHIQKCVSEAASHPKGNHKYYTREITQSAKRYRSIRFTSASV